MANEHTIKINIQADDKPVKSLKAELKETIQQLQRMDQGSEEFTKLTQKAAELKDQMADINEQVNVFASGSKYEQASNGLGEIGSAIKNLDFDKAAARAKSFATVAKSITFGDAIKSVKDLGSTFLTLGKAILTNPLFLIAAVVAAIVAGVIALLDELGILKTIFKAVGDAIGFVIQSLKDLLDWLGLTDYASEDNANKEAKRQEKVAAAHEKKREKVTDAYDHEIRMAKIAGKDTTDLERQKQFAIIKTSEQQHEALNTQIIAMRAAGTLTKEKADEIRKAMAELKTGIREARQEVQAINAQELADEKKANEDKAKERATAATNRKAQQAQYAADRLAALRAIEDAELQLMKEGIEKEIKENEIKYARLIEDTKKNEKLLQTEKDELVFNLKKQKYEADLAIDKKYLDEKAAAEKEAADKKAELDEKQKQAVIAGAAEMAKKNQEFAAKQVEDAAKAAAEKATIEQQYRDSVVALSEGIFALTNSLGKQDEKSKEQRAKRQFNIQKAMNLGMAVIDGYKAITASLSQSPVAIGPVPNPAGIASLTFAIATSAANIAKIAAARFGGGGGGGATGGGGGALGGSATPSMGQQQVQQTPQMNLNNGVGQNAGGEAMRERVIVVDYHDIQDKGNELQMSQQRVTLA